MSVHAALVFRTTTRLLKLLEPPQLIFVSGLRDRLLSFCPRFNTSVVASRQNRAFWPTEDFTSGEELPKELSTGLFFASTFLFENVQAGKILRSVTLPMDQVTRFLDNLARVEAKSKEYFFSEHGESLILFPSIGRPVALSDIMVSMNNNYRLVDNIKTVVISSASLGDDDVVTPFVEKAKKLERLTLAKCSIRSIAPTALAEMQKSSLTTLDLQENDLGIEDDATEEVSTALGDLLKYNKFLLTVNLSQNNFTPKQSRALFDALAVSDTTLLPDDLPAEPEEELPPIEEYVDRTIFFGEDEEDEEDEPEEESEEEQEEAEEDEEQSEEGEEGEGDEEAPKIGKKKKAFRDDSDEEDEGEEQEEAEEAEEAADNEEEEGEEGEEGEEPAVKIDPRIERRYNRLIKRLFRDEGKDRKELVLEYLSEALDVAQEILRIRERKEKEKQDRINKYCKRRSGWSHIQEIYFRGNRLGDVGAAGVALTLRDEVKLTEEETERISTEMSEKADALAEKIVKARRDTLTLEMKEYRLLLREERQMRREIKLRAENAAKAAVVHPAFILNENDEENDEEREEQEIGSVIMTNVEDEAQDETLDDNADIDGDEPEEAEGEAELDERERWEIPFPPRKSGLNSIRVLDLGSCEIGSRGLKKISTTLESNKVLEKLVLRNNIKFAVLFKKVEAEDDEEAEEGHAEQKVEVPHFVSPGFTAFTSMLRVNKTLKHIDLGYCQLSADGVLLLSRALLENSTIEYLNLEGNKVGEIAEVRSDPPKEEGASPAEGAEGAEEREGTVELIPCLPHLLESLIASSVKHLSLSSNDLSEALGIAEVKALGTLTGKLLTLELNNVGLTRKQLNLWANAVEQSALTSLQLNRNYFDGSEDGTAALQELKRLHSSTADGAVTIPPTLLESLNYLSLADMSCTTLDDLCEWVSLMAAHGKALRYLALWSRNINMEVSLDPFLPLVETLVELLYIDFGVLLRFDMDPPDVTDTLGTIEKVLTARRLQRSFVDPPPPETVETTPPEAAVADTTDKTAEPQGGDTGSSETPAQAHEEGISKLLQLEGVGILAEQATATLGEEASPAEEAGAKAEEPGEGASPAEEPETEWKEDSHAATPPIGDLEGFGGGTAGSGEVQAVLTHPESSVGSPVHEEAEPMEEECW
eukprot:gene13365-9194_t